MSLPLPPASRSLACSEHDGWSKCKSKWKYTYPPGVFVNFFLPSSFERLRYSRGFIVSLDLYRKLNGEMKNRGTGKKWKKLRVLNSEKCDEIGRNVCTFITNIRVTAKGKRENIFFILCICINIFFFLEGAGWRDARVYTFVRDWTYWQNLSNVNTAIFLFFFFFCIQKISFRNIGTVKGFIRDLQYGVYSKVKLINFVSRRIFNFPAEIQFRYSIAVNNNNNNDSEIINSSGHRLIDLAARLL